MISRGAALCRTVRPRCGKAAGCLCSPQTFDFSPNRLRSNSAAKTEGGTP
jgi:hypothetical protein